MKEHDETHSNTNDKFSSVYPTNTFYFEESLPVIEKLINSHYPILNELAKRLNTYEEYLNRANDLKLMSIKGGGSFRREVIGLTKEKIEEMKRNKTFKANSRNTLGLKPIEDWIYNISISNIMNISPLKLQDLAISSEIAHEISKDALYEKVIMIVIAYFSIAVEYRFMHSGASIYQWEAKYWHKAAVEVACTFLPSKCPLVEYIVSSYEKHNPLIQENIVILLVKEF